MIEKDLTDVVACVKTIHGCTLGWSYFIPQFSIHYSVHFTIYKLFT